MLSLWAIDDKVQMSGGDIWEFGQIWKLDGT